MANKIIQLKDGSDNLYPQIDSRILSWTPHIYDNNTMVGEIPSANASYVKIGRLCVLYFNWLIQSDITISQMLQIRHMPVDMNVIGGCIYYAGVNDKLGARTVQAVAGRFYPRPNWTGTLQSGDWFTAMIIGFSTS